MSANNQNLAGGVLSKRGSTLNQDDDDDGRSMDGSDSYGAGRGSISDNDEDDGQSSDGGDRGQRRLPARRSTMQKGGTIKEMDEEDDESYSQRYVLID